MHRGWVPRQVRELRAMGFSSTCHSLRALLWEGPRCLPGRSSLFYYPLAAEKFLFHLTSCWLQFLCHHTFCSSLSSYLDENLYH